MPTPFPPDFDPEKIPDSAWEFDGYSADGLRRYWIAWIDRDKGTYVKKTENLAEPEILDQNRQDFDDSQNKRFGDGKIVARIPLNVFYRDFPKRLQDGDKDFVKWFLNHPDNRPYRTFRGRI